jgi:hypothetical protein
MQTTGKMNGDRTGAGIELPGSPAELLCGALGHSARAYQFRSSTCPWKKFSPDPLDLADTAKAHLGLVVANRRNRWRQIWTAVCEQRTESVVWPVCPEDCRDTVWEKLENRLFVFERSGTP